jgi:hypothetical protein
VPEEVVSSKEVVAIFSSRKCIVPYPMYNTEYKVSLETKRVAEEFASKRIGNGKHYYVAKEKKESLFMFNKVGRLRLLY